MEAQSNIPQSPGAPLGKVALQRHELVLDLSGDSAVFTWEALRQTPEGGLWSLVRSQSAAQLLREQSQNLPDLRRPAILIGEPRELPALLAAQKQDTVRFDAIVGRNILCSSHDRTGLAPFWRLC